jgi:hypothetical protein
LSGSSRINSQSSDFNYQTPLNRIDPRLIRQIRVIRVPFFFSASRVHEPKTGNSQKSLSGNDTAFAFTVGSQNQADPVLIQLGSLLRHLHDPAGS